MSIIKNNKDIIRVILIEKINNEFHFKKIPVVEENWPEGEHPEQCKGKCSLTIGVFSISCSVCGWDDY